MGVNTEIENWRCPGSAFVLGDDVMFFFFKQKTAYEITV